MFAELGGPRRGREPSQKLGRALRHRLIGLLGVAVDPSTGNVYVANNGNSTASVINGSTNTVTATVTVGSAPYGVAVDPTTNTVYVANSSSNTVSVFDGQVAAPGTPGTPSAVGGSG
jgi:YVTN family beta-propeller protein